MICGMLMVFVVGQCMLYLGISTATTFTVEVLKFRHQMRSRGELGSDRDFLPKDSKRQLQIDDYDSDWEAEYGWLRHLNGAILFAFWLIIACVSLPVAWIYWKLYIYPTHEKYLTPGMIMPQELMGRFKYGLFDCSGDCGMCMCLFFCQWCAFGEFFYRAGHTHAISGNSTAPIQGCHGWQFFLGCCGCCLLGEALGWCSPCVMAALTSGLGWLNHEGGGRSGMGSIITFRERFGLVAPDCNAFCCDCCAWMWCFPCQATREWQQINDALKQWPLPMPQAPPSMVVGQPVVLQGQAVGVVSIDPKVSPAPIKAEVINNEVAA